MNDSEPVKLASLLLAAAHGLLQTYKEQLVLWIGDAQWAQRCCLCGLWFTEGTQIRCVYNVTRSKDVGSPVGDYAHLECPEPT